jgi:hypothetical protein
MEAVQVSGRFINEFKQPLEGRITFLPSKLWQVDIAGVSWATLAPEVELMDGKFCVNLTRTDQHQYPWHYKVICPGPIGTWSIRAEGDQPLLLADLLPAKFRTP